MDALLYRHRLRHQSLPVTWLRIEMRCPACGRFFIGVASPREDAREGRQAARVRLIRTCPRHAARFNV
jgi:kynureninase